MPVRARFPREHGPSHELMPYIYFYDHLPAATLAFPSYTPSYIHPGHAHDTTILYYQLFRLLRSHLLLY